MKCDRCNTEHPTGQTANPHYCIARLSERVEMLESDALTMSLRLLGEDDSTFSPECHEVMTRWGKTAMEAL